MVEMPSGTVTFLFTDIEGSTRLWESHPAAMSLALARHDALLREAIEGNGGFVFRTEGDAFRGVFSTAGEAVRAAIAAQAALGREPWGETGPLLVRMALHSGAPLMRDGEYHGPLLNRAARLLAAANGGQVLLSRAACDLAADSLPEGAKVRDMGEHVLKDLQRPENIYELIVEGLPADARPLRTLDNRPNNLPLQPTPLVGREKELGELVKMLHSREARLITLSGPGGTGKTRLAVQAAAEAAEAFADGVFFVSLQAIDEHSLVMSAIAQTLGLKEGQAATVSLGLQEYLSGREMLVVLDNFEQVVDAAPQVAELLAASPRLKVLITSRGPLRVRGEKEYPVSPLELPDPARLPPLEQLGDFEAIRLFRERAKDVRPDFELAAANAAAVAEICARLDGLPLAIELAAARVRLMTPQAMLPLLKGSLKLLTGGARDVPARHQTLRGAMAWSYNLLDPAEQRLFRRLSIFAGSFTLETAALVDGEGDDVFDGVASLVENSLIRQTSSAELPRYEMLRTVREYGIEELAASGESQETRRREVDYYLDFAARLERRESWHEDAVVIAEIDHEYENFREVLAWAVESDTDALVRLCSGLLWFWIMRGSLAEGEQWVEEAARNPGARGHPRYIRLLIARGALASFHNKSNAIEILKEAVATARTQGDKATLASALVFLGMAISTDWGRYAAEEVPEEVLRSAQEIPEELVALARDLGDDYLAAQALLGSGLALVRVDASMAAARLQEGLAYFRNIGAQEGVLRAAAALGDLARANDDYAAATSYYEDSLAIARSLGARRELPAILHNLGHVAIGEGRLDDALALFLESLDIHRELGNNAGIAEALGGFAGLAAHRGQPARAARLFGAVDTMRASEDLPLWYAEQHDQDKNTTLARSQTSAREWDEAFAEGKAMRAEQAIDYALDDDAVQT